MSDNKKEIKSGTFILYGLLCIAAGGICLYLLITGKVKGVLFYNYIPIPLIILCPIALVAGLYMVISSIVPNKNIRPRKSLRSGLVYDSSVLIPKNEKQRKQREIRRVKTESKIQEYKKEKKIKNLLKFAFDKDYWVRRIAQAAINETVDKRNVILFVKILKNKKPGLHQKYATEMLGNLGVPQAIEPLINALKSEFNDVRRSASTSLTKITGINHRKASISSKQEHILWQNWWKSNKDKYVKKR